ncbi:hypothetical protein MKZ38_004734 [Zalerion maritima]|uniref:Aminoglycoside phosphotransferase domain-containing protein n=1 Tax=Zalerion maritima TaxID=339359 RepID=A0AAD5WWT6_9PEZI|nr:hypothetical protein MKZ38_004734 [Zalerion maritima]
MATGYDFKTYLSSVDPKNSYDIEPLQGGLVNYTVRAKKTSKSHRGIFRRHKSLILKQAPDFVAAAGPSLPFSKERQKVEAAALQVLDPSGPLGHVGENEMVITPTLIRHDEDNSVIVMKDLEENMGPLITLWDFLKNPQGSRDHVALICGVLGRRTGSFLAKLHRKVVRGIILGTYGAGLSNPLAHTFTRSLVRDAAVDTLQERIATVNAEAAKHLADRVAADFDRENMEFESCFGIGDFHPGSILVAPWMPKHSFPYPLAVMGWEFATSDGRGVNGDLAHFLAPLHLLALSTDVDSLCSVATRTFIDQMTTAYSKVTTRVVSRDPKSPEVRQDLALLRSALIMHGREIINQAVEKDWAREDDFTKEMISLGAWYLERAGDSVSNMVEEENWTLLQSGEDQGKLLSVFTFC